jgi:hypothetical protein
MNFSFILRKVLLNLTALILLFNSCSFSEKEFPVNPPFDPDSPCLCYPLGIGYEWIYKDSSLYLNELRSVKVISNERDTLGRIIWNLENKSIATMFFLGKMVYLKNDTLYTIDLIPPYRDRTITYLRLVPPKSNEFIFSTWHHDIVGIRFRVIYHKNKPIKVGKYIFNHWISYSKVTVSKDIDSTIVVPEVGIVYHYKEINNMDGTKSITKSELVEFKKN